MSALALHLSGDCWSPCYYCMVEDQDQELDDDSDREA